MARAVKRPDLKRRLHERPPPRESSAELPVRSDDAARPRYSADYIAELKAATPSAPVSTSDPSGTAALSQATQEVDIASKFGDSALAIARDPLASDTDKAYIPSEAEIREKKERRRRLAAEHAAGADRGSDDEGSGRQEQDFVSLDNTGGRSHRRLYQGTNSEDENDDDISRPRRPKGGSLIIPAEEVELKSKYGSTRLEHEDEDIAEGFDDFVEDAGRVALGRRAAKQQEKDRKKALEEQIKAAQHGYGYGAGVSGSEDEDDEAGEGDDMDEEEAARNKAYEAAQTRAGTYAANVTGSARVKERDKDEAERRRLELPKTKPIPEFKTVVARFADTVKIKEAELAQKRRHLERVGKEQEEIEREEERVKSLLREAGERFEKLQAETGAPPALANGEAESHGQAMETYKTVAPTEEDSAAVPDADSSEDERPAFGGLDSLSGRFPGAGVSGMAALPKDEDEDDYY